MSASLPIDFFTRRIDNYGMPTASPHDPMSASVNDLGADSPKAKWLTDRPASYYYAPPVSAEPVEEEETETEEKETEKGKGKEKEAETVVATPPADAGSVTSAPESEKKKEKETEEGEEDKQELQFEEKTSRGPEGTEGTTEGVVPREDHESVAAPSAADLLEEGQHEQQPGQNVDKEPLRSGDTEAAATESENAVGPRESEGDSTTTIAPREEEMEEEVTGQVEEVTEPTTNQPEPSGAEGPVLVDDGVNVESTDGQEETPQGTIDSPDEAKLSARGSGEEQDVLELKEIIKLTEEEDKEEEKKMEDIQNRIKNMRSTNSLNARLELAGLGAKELSSSIFYGLRDSLRVKHTTISIQKSNRVYNHIIDTMILNGLLLLVMYLLFQYVLAPHFHSMLSWKEHRGFALVLVGIMEFLLKAAFLTLWLGPIYVLSVVLNMQWAQEVGNGAFSLYLYIRRGKIVQKAAKPLSDTIAQIIYWQIIFGVFNLLNFLCKFVPIVGPPFYFVCMCWLNAVYCFDYKWGNQKWSLHKKISYCETRWLYFIGFGLPITLATFFFEYIISYSAVSLLFPLFIPMAMYGSPKTQSLWKPIPMSRFLDSSIIAPLIRFIFTVPSQVEKLEQKVETIGRFLVTAFLLGIGLGALGVVCYLVCYLTGTLIF